MGLPHTRVKEIRQLLAEYNTDAILLRRTPQSYNMWTYVDQSPQWVPVLLGRRYGIFLRAGSEPLRRVGELIRSGQEWRPDDAWALASKGHVFAFTQPPDYEQAIDCWRTAMRQDLLTGTVTFKPWTIALIQLGRPQEAMQMLAHYHKRLSTKKIPGVADDQRQAMLGLVQELWRAANQAATKANQKTQDKPETGPDGG